MFIGFFDDTEVLASGKIEPDVYVFGGYFILQSQLEKFQRRIFQIKEEYGLKGHFPIKWNWKASELKCFYEEQRLLENYNKLFKIGNQIRRPLLQLLKEFHAIVMACGLYRQAQTTKHVDCYRWAFENLLQRIGMMAKSHNIGSSSENNFIIVVDWPQGGVNKRLFDIYMSGYHEGKAMDSNQAYFSGPLSTYHFVDSLFHSSTIHCSSLQVADLVAGVLKDFIRWCIKDDHAQRVREYFSILSSCFYSSDKGVINGYGLKISGINIDLDGKILELLKTEESEVVHE
ncbi:MAG: DUF3800 domain-containing protein [Caldiserica bacterium]|jgi:tRNA A37 threonylcarbamoyladenosine biosynthesis protein TsaE|nr:DUF3800 domain-containing protein [Caldisericota bacterium]